MSRSIFFCLFVLAGGELLGGGEAIAAGPDGVTNAGRVTVVAPPNPTNYDGRVTVTAPPRTRTSTFWRPGNQGGGWFGYFDTDYVQTPPEPESVPDIPLEERSASVGNNPCEDLDSNPVVIATGNKVEFENDFRTATGDGLDLIRTYNHYWTGERGVFGYKWLTNHDYRVSYSSDVCRVMGEFTFCDETPVRTIVAWRPDGRRLEYKAAGDGTYRSADAPSTTRMEFNAQGQLVYYAEDEGVEVYGGIGTGDAGIINRTSITGEKLIYEYGPNGVLARVSHSSGRYIEFLWDPETASVRKVRDPAGHYHTYGYTQLAWPKSILSSHSQAESGVSIAYHYEDPSFAAALTGKSVNGVRYSTFKYDGSGRVSSSEHAGGVNRHTFLYGSSDGEYCDDSGCYAYGITTHFTKITNPLGKVTTHNYVDGRKVSVEGAASASCPLSSTLKSYDDNNRVDKSTDTRGVVTDYDYDTNGRLVKTTEALGTPDERITTLVWDPSRDRLLSSTLSKGGAAISRTEHTYASDNRIESVRHVNLTGTGVSGQVLQTTYAYTKYPNGMVASVTVDGPLPGSTDATTSRFNSSGDLVAEENGLGHAVTYSGHNGLGVPSRQIGVNGDVTDYTYNALGLITNIRRYPNGAAADTTYTYSGGRLLSVRTPDGVTRLREYDAAWRVIRESQQEPGGTYAATRYTYNNASLVTSEITERTGEPAAPPAAPTSPTFTASATGSSGSHLISWGGAGSAEYYVLEESIGGGAWAQVYSGSDLSWRADGRAPGTYNYRIKACSASSGCSTNPSLITITVTLNIVPILYELLLS